MISWMAKLRQSSAIESLAAHELAHFDYGGIVAREHVADLGGERVAAIRGSHSVEVRSRRRPQSSSSACHLPEARTESGRAAARWSAFFKNNQKDPEM